MNIFCSTMIASYKRPFLLIEAIRSFRQQATRPSEHRVVVRLSDSDNIATHQREMLLREFNNCHVIIGSQMSGYESLGEYFTEMLPLVMDSEWMNIFDDDMIIEGPWDEQLHAAPKRAIVLCDGRITNGMVEGADTLSGSGMGWFVNIPEWKALGEFTIRNPPDWHMWDSLNQKRGWPFYHLHGVKLIHRWQRPLDGGR